LNADAPENTARREKGATKKRERPNPPHKQQQQGPVSNKPQPKTRTTTCETCDPTNLELSYIFNNTPQRKVPWPTEREREYTYFVP
jgi:hypothetical protein